MDKADYDRLMRLKGSVDYRRAIEHLFQVSTEGETAGSRCLGRILAVLVAACLILAGMVWRPLTNRSHETDSGTHTQSVSAAN